MLYFSKSKYCGLWQCPKIAWMHKYKPDEFEMDGNVKARQEAGNEVGDLAMGLFGDYVEVTTRREDGHLDLTQMTEKTQAEMEKKTPVICEASFIYEGLYCAVDLLRREGDGWAIYEVKSSTHEDKTVYYIDIAYQKYVLEHCGVNVTGAYLVVLNKEYVYNGTYDLKKLFRISDVNDLIQGEYELVEQRIQMAQAMLGSPEEPEMELSNNCREPYLCGFWQYCTRHLPTPSVFDLYRLDFQKKIHCYQKGLASYEDLAKAGWQGTEKQNRQIDFALHDRGLYVNKEKIKEYLDGLSYPLYFLDFETVMSPLPHYVGSHPYEQIPFQYSLHYIEHEGGELKHKEFLAEPGTDPRRALAKQLCEDIPMDVCVTAYNKGFECNRIKELAEQFPDLAEHLSNIKEHIVDLIDPFQKGWCYNRAMGGSFSIKSVLPALFPDDPALDYHNLEGVHNGSEAMNAFPAMASMSPEEQAQTRENLLRYCELDTFAMVKLWEKLKEVAE